jgi:hypothetical protein
MTDRTAKSEAWKAATASIAVVVVLACLYGAGYFYFGDPWRPGPPPGPHPIRMRVFPQNWLAHVYRPVAWLESKARGYPIAAGDDEALRLSSP